MTASSILRTTIANAWLIPDCICDKGGFQIKLDHALEGAAGDGVVLLRRSAAGVLIHGFARIYRIRTEVDGCIVYFDAYKHLEAPIATADIAETDGKSAKRLDWTRFLDLLRKTVGIEFGALPVIGTTGSEQSHIRELLKLAVRDDLLGPASGPQEEIIGMSVRDRYLVGKLAPRIGIEGGDDFIEGLHGPTAEEAEEEEEVELDDLRPFEEEGPGREKHARRRMPGEEFSSLGDGPDLDDTESDSLDASKNQSFIPSAIGLTVCVDSTVNVIDVRVSWGRYQKQASEYAVDDKGNAKRAWKRIPSGGSVALSVAQEEIKPVVPDDECPRVLIKGSVRSDESSKLKLVTVFLVNNQPELEQNQDEAWLFQPEIVLRDPEGRAIFHKRPIPNSAEIDPERDALEMIYRHHVEFAVGHCTSVRANYADNRRDRATEVRTVVLPEFEVPITETPGTDPSDRQAMRSLVESGYLDMKTLAELEKPDLLRALSVLVEDYSEWIDEQRDRVSRDVGVYGSAAAAAVGRCAEILRRLKEGIETLSINDDALQAFRFANQAMATQRVRSIYSLGVRRGNVVPLEELDQRKNRSWRPFQLAFILLSIPALADPLHRDRTKPIDAYADLLWFPTGGGKTEAYLGVAAFAMAIRRLQGSLGGLDGSRGLSVIMRYTLRLLTLQQFQRASTLICSMEILRRKNPKVWGNSPFTLGLWVGLKVTPNDTEDSHHAIESIRTSKRPSGSTPAQLMTCPWCGSEIAAGRDIQVRRFQTDTGRTVIFCGDKLGRCEFSSRNSPDIGLPVIVVDDEIYRRPPSMLIATVDKFAMMAWRGQVRTLFGYCTSECPRHGLLWEESDCNGRHPRSGSLPAVSEQRVTRLRPPDLIIQDEFHLISGPLGTMVGLYETAVDELSTWQLNEQSVRPKVIASSATVRKAAEQMNNVFLRRAAIFPPHGLDVEDNFFALIRPTEQKPGRLYIGICAPGSARPAVLIRVYTAVLTAAQALFERFGPHADPWMTLVGYFNSLRELGGMRRLAEDDVQTRSYRVQMSDVVRPGLAQRNVKNVDELTSRVQSKDIPSKLDQLEIVFSSDMEPDGRFRVRWARTETQPLDIVLATNMLSVGVDVNRLGLMVVNGQPKSTAEYIQATSRVGRSFPGLVLSVLTWSKPRDLSHYETFEHYHATFYKHVEAQSVTPFAPRALDRGLTGTLVSWLRLSKDQLNPNLGAHRMNSPSKPEIAESKQVMSQRAWRVTDKLACRSLTEAMVQERMDEWVKESTRGARRLGYEGGKSRKQGQGDVAGLLRKPGAENWDLFTAPMSLREVEPDVRLVMTTDHIMDGPDWRPSIDSSKGDD